MPNDKTEQQSTTRSIAEVVILAVVCFIVFVSPFALLLGYHEFSYSFFRPCVSNGGQWVEVDENQLECQFPVAKRVRKDSLKVFPD